MNIVQGPLLFVVGTGYSTVHPQGVFSWKSRYLSSSKVYLASNVPLQEISHGVLYFTKPEFKQRNALVVNVTRVRKTDAYFTLEYTIRMETSVSSYTVKQVLKLLLQKQSVYDLPYCAVVEAEKFQKVLNTIDLSTTIRLLTEQCRWEAIVDLANQYGPLEKSELWNHPNVLQGLAFAIAKLAECTVNVRKLFSDKRERDKFLEQKRIYRETALRIRNRLIELAPNDPAHYGNIAYLHYLSTIELSMPGGRRDGDAEKEAYCALTYFTKALQLDPYRISDAYRKGQLLVRILPRILMYARTEPETLQARIEQVNNLLAQGIEVLRVAKHMYEQCTDETIKKRMQKYYIKLLYILAHAYLQKGKCTFVVSRTAIEPKNFGSEQKIMYLNTAIQTLEQCILTDALGIGAEDRALEINGFICAVYKAYTKGVMYLYRYAHTRDEVDRSRANDSLQQALELSFPKELRNQNRLFVLEKLAVLSLLAGNPHGAINYLERLYKFKKQVMPEYCAYTLALAYMLCGNINEAEDICTQMLQRGQSIMKQKFERLKACLYSDEHVIEYNEEEHEGVEEPEP
ncbi:MAG: hypothetical protein N3A63_01150 [Bacteroidetes bacterium]|nr:hypothetical protein [Bacteroidota bacterium]